MGGRGWWYLNRASWLARLRKCPRYPSLASGDRVHDRRSCIRTPIRTKLRPMHSARRARRSYLTAVTFQQHFSAPHKIIRLLNKRGLRSGGDGWTCAGCDGARVKSRCRKGRVPCWLGVGLRPIREYGGEIFTDYYFGEANTANKSDNYHNNAINENLNWGGFPGCYRYRALWCPLRNWGTTLFCDPLTCDRTLASPFHFHTV